MSVRGKQSCTETWTYGQQPFWGLREIPARPEDVAILLPLLDDQIDDVRAAAERSIGGAGDAAAVAVPRMIRLLEDPNIKVCIDTATGPGDIGGGARDAIPALKHLLRTRFPSGHSDISAALKKIATSTRAPG